VENHSNRLVLLLFIIVSISAICLSGCGHEHKWEDATCTVPKTCVDCGETEGEPLGHEWVDATCTTPATCKRCGETVGNAIGHKWAEATCEEPKHCVICEEIKGEALGHDWTEATYDAPKTCSRCGLTEGEPIPRVEENKSKYVVDDAQLFTAEQIDTLITRTQDLRSELGFDVAVHTTDDSNGLDAESYTNAYYDIHYADDGILLALFMDQRVYHICTTGKCIEMFESSFNDDSFELFIEYLKQGKYFEAIEEYLDTVERIANKGTDK